MTRGAVVRVAHGGDVAAIASLRARWTGGGEEDGDFAVRMAAWLAAEGARRTTWLAVVDGRPVGMASLFEYRRMPKPGRPASCWGYVSNVFVREELRGHGIGAALLAALVAAADARGYARLVVTPAAEARSLYRRAGFHEPGERAGPEPMLVRPGRAGGGV